MKHCLALATLLLAGQALADSPPPPRTKFTECSSSRNICAVSDPATDTTFVASPASQNKAWTIPGWHRWLFLSDDGQSVVVGYEGLNLAPLDVTLREPVLFFYHRGKLVRTVAIGDLYERKSQLERTVSHYAWIRLVPYINDAGQLVVERVDGKKLAFAPSTGLPQPLTATKNVTRP